MKKLEERGFIFRLDNKFDKRSKLVKITNEGEDICKKVFKDILIYENNCFSCLDLEEQEVFYKLLIKILRNM